MVVDGGVSWVQRERGNRGGYLGGVGSEATVAGSWPVVVSWMGRYGLLDVRLFTGRGSTEFYSSMNVALSMKLTLERRKEPLECLDDYQRTGNL